MFVPRSLSSSNPLHKTFPLRIPTHIPFSRPLPLGRKTLILHGSGRVGIGSGRRRLEGVRSQNGGEALSSVDEEWIKKLPDKKKPLYAHSLPCIEAWLRQLGFFQNGDDDRALWIAEKHDWHARLSLDITDLHIRYLKSGPGNLVKDVERRFSYALSREDIENAILGGP